MIQKIPCPSCGEPNFSSGIICWKCGSPLDQPEEPAPVSEPVTEFESRAEEIGAPDHQPNAIMEAIIAMETEEITHRKNLFLAVIIGGIMGVLVSLLFEIPFYMWLRADYLPLSAAIPFTLLSVLGGAAAGALAVHHPYGAVAGMAAYTASLILLRILAVAPSMVAPPELWTYHLFSGYFIAYLGMLVAVLVLRLMGRRIVPPGLLAKNPLIGNNLKMVALPIIMAVILTLSIFRYQNAKDTALNDPVRVVAGFCWAAASGWSGDPTSIGCMLSETFPASRISSLKPDWPLPSQRTIKSLALGGDSDQVQVIPRGAATDVTLKISSEGWTPGLLKAPGSDAESRYLITFTLTSQDGTWKISAPPAVSFPEGP